MTERIEEDVMSQTNSWLIQSMQVAFPRLISLNKLTKAFKDMAKQRSSGLDGIPVEFYLVLWPIMDRE